MKNIILGVLLALVVVLGYKSCSNSNNEKTIISENSALIQEQLKNVGKLVVTEGHFSQVYNYKNTKAVFGNLIDTEKKALVVVNADVTVAYDLSKLEYDIDEATKTLTLIKIPEEEVKISPDFEYYDVQADYLNPFKAEDYNKIKSEAKNAISNKINNSDLRKNAKNRLVSELSKFYILTNSLGWTLKYNETPIGSRDAIENLEPVKL
tara:strand:+ start:55 stop:678 length:624 start_codon:yes stop_codon:yes gene_type:complete